MRYKKIIDPIYEAQVHVIYDCTPEEMNKKCKVIFKGLKDEASKPIGHARCFEIISDSGYQCYVLWFRHFKPTADILYIIVHEASHLVDFIFKHLGVGNDTEARAYYLEYWVIQLWRLCSSHKKGS